MDCNLRAGAWGRGVSLLGFAIAVSSSLGCSTKSMGSPITRRVSDAHGGSSGAAQTTGGGDGLGGSLSLNVPDGGDPDGMASGATGALPPGTLPPDFTMADVGGYKLGDPIQTDGSGASSAGTGGSAGAPSGFGATILAVLRDVTAARLQVQAAD